MATLAELKRENARLRAKLASKNTVTVAVYTNGTEISVVGVFDQSKSGIKACEAVEAAMEEWGERPRTANWIISDELVMNVSKPVRVS